MKLQKKIINIKKGLKIYIYIKTTQYKEWNKVTVKKTLIVQE